MAIVRQASHDFRSVTGRSNSTLGVLSAGLETTVNGYGLAQIDIVSGDQ